ncbi:hypothetical protein HZS_7063, partial [Henneguya salminicola]
IGRYPTYSEFLTRGNTLNNDTSARIIEAYNRGNICQIIEEVFEHKRTTEHDIVKRYFLTDEIKSKPRVTHTKKANRGSRNGNQRLG